VRWPAETTAETPVDALFVVGSFTLNGKLPLDAKGKQFTGKLGSDPRDFCGRKVKEVVRTAGLKLVCQDGAWVCYRLSGTEPVVRVYTEAGSEQELERMGVAAKQWIFE
jgi:phosphomannomutase